MIELKRSDAFFEIGILKQNSELNLESALPSPIFFGKVLFFDPHKLTINLTIQIQIPSAPTTFDASSENMVLGQIGHRRMGLSSYTSILDDR